MDHRLKRIKTATHSGARELAHAGLKHAAKALETHGAGIVAIATDDWTANFDRALKGGASHHATTTRKAPKRSKGKRKSKGKRRKGHRSAAQRAATAKMLRAAKGRRRKGGAKRKSKRRKKR